MARGRWIVRSTSIRRCRTTVACPPSTRSAGVSRERLRRRGPAEDSTGQDGVARRFADTPMEYPCAALPSTSGSHSAGQTRTPMRALRSRARHGSRRSDTFDTHSGAALSSAGRRRAMCPAGHRRVCVPLGEDEASVPEAGSRGSQDRLNEADVSAQEAPPSQGTRLSRPHEDDRGTPDPGCAASSGSEATDGLTSDRGTSSPRLVMLSRPQDFAAIQERGTTRSHPLFSARFLRTDLSTTRFGISTGRKLGGAVVRNRVRRRLREALRVMAPSFQPGWDVLIIARPGIVAADHDALVGALHRTLVRGGVLGGIAR